MMNFKERTLRRNNYFINLSLALINIVLIYLFVFMPSYRVLCESILAPISETIFGFLPIYYFYKQFSSKGKYINILPLSMRKTYLIILLDWLTIYAIGTFIRMLTFNISTNQQYLEYLNSSITLNHALSFIRMNLIIISGIIIVKFYKINWLLVLGGFIGIQKIIDMLFSLLFFKKQSWGISAIFYTIPSIPYSKINILIFILAVILFLFMSTKLDKLSIE